MTCTCNTGPGKFEGEPALAYLAWSQGFSDDDIGPVQFFKGPFTDLSELAKDALAYGYCQECISEACQSKAYGISLYESDQGFVSLVEYQTEAEYQASVKECEEAESEEDMED